MIPRLPVSRRQFLSRSGRVLTGACAAPFVIPASALGRGGRAQGGGPLLGGAWTYLAGGYTARKDVQVLAVCDVWRPRRESAQQRVNRHYAETYGKGNYRSCEAYVDFRNG